MGRLTGVLERAVTENRQMLQRRSRIGRLRALLRAQTARLREDAASAAREAEAAADRGASVARGRERALQQIEIALEHVWQRLARAGSEMKGELSEAMARDR